MHTAYWLVEVIKTELYQPQSIVFTLKNKSQVNISYLECLGPETWKIVNCRIFGCICLQGDTSGWNPSVNRKKSLEFHMYLTHNLRVIFALLLVCLHLEYDLAPNGTLCFRVWIFSLELNCSAWYLYPPCLLTLLFYWVK